MNNCQKIGKVKPKQSFGRRRRSSCLMRYKGACAKGLLDKCSRETFWTLT